MEYCEGGDLFNYIMCQDCIDEKESAKIMYKIVSAVKHMHDKNVIHRDLKPENILFSSRDPN